MPTPPHVSTSISSNGGGMGGFSQNNQPVQFHPHMGVAVNQQNQPHLPVNQPVNQNDQPTAMVMQSPHAINQAVQSPVNGTGPVRAHFQHMPGQPHLPGQNTGNQFQPGGHQVAHHPHPPTPNPQSITTHQNGPSVEVSFPLSREKACRFREIAESDTKLIRDLQKFGIHSIRFQGNLIFCENLYSPSSFVWSPRVVWSVFRPSEKPHKGR